MTAKAWSAGEIRAIARQTVDGRKAISTARGAYFRALVETAQAELGGKADQSAQLAAVKAVHRRFYPVVQESIATDELIAKDGFPRKKIALERNRRMNFARSAYGTIRAWLRAEGHDLMKLDSQKVTKSQLLSESPPSRKHALTQERINVRAKKLTDGIVGFARQIAKADQAQGAHVANMAIEALVKFLVGDVSVTRDAHVAANESRPLAAAGKLFWPTEIRARKVA